MIGYRDMIDGAVHLALVMGDIDPEEPSLIRVHDSLRDLVHSQRRDTGWPLGDAMDRVSRKGRGWWWCSAGTSARRTSSVRSSR